MSLLKLLSTGKSLIGMKSTTSPYRMRTSGRLPKFNSAKNPFAPMPKTEPVNGQTKSSPGRMETDSLFETETKPAVVRKAPAVKEVKPAAPAEPKPESKPVSAVPAAKAAKSGALAGLVKKLNPLAYFPKREPGARAARPKTARTAVQGELSLEKVRPLRNDLNDSDLEFVSAKPAASMGTAGTMLPAMPRPKLTTWGRWTSRVLGEMETQTQ